MALTPQKTMYFKTMRFASNILLFPSTPALSSSRTLLQANTLQSTSKKLLHRSFMQFAAPLPFNQHQTTINGKK